MHVYYKYIIIVKKPQKAAVTKTTPLPEDNYSYWKWKNTITATNSFNDRLIFSQNVQINSEWKRHCAITKKNVWV